MKYTYLIFITSFLFSCHSKPKAIEYGFDHCSFCKMTVVDKTHAAQYVTQKGKNYTFDAIECMIRKGKKENDDYFAHLLVADFSKPGHLIDAKNASFLVSEGIKSPMGANLSAFSTKEMAEKAKAEHGGTIYTWNEIKKQLK